MSFDVNKATPGIGSQFDGIIIAASNQYGVPVALIKAIISHESAWNPNAVNPSDPSYGLMQLNAHYWKNPDGSPILDPTTNINVGTGFLGQLIKQYGDLSSVISAYNAGHPITGNALYVADVLAYYNWFLANDPLLTRDGGGDGSLITPDGITIPSGPSDTDLQIILGIVIAVGLLVLMLRK